MISQTYDFLDQQVITDAKDWLANNLPNSANNDETLYRLNVQFDDIPAAQRFEQEFLSTVQV